MTCVLLPFKKGELYGFCDPHENEIVPPRFRYAKKSTEGVAVATTFDNDTVLIHTDTLREIHLKGLTHGTRSFVHGRLGVRSNISDRSPYGFVDRDGEFVIEPRFSGVFDFDQFGAKVNVLSDNQLTHRINRAGEFVGQSFLSIGFFHPRGRYTGATVEWDFPGMTLIDAKCERVIDEKYVHVWKENDGLIPVIYDKWDVGWINSEGVELARFSAEGIGHCFQDGLVPVEDHNYKWGLMNLQRDWVIEPGYDFVDFLAPTRLILGNHKNNDPEKGLVAFLSDIEGRRIGQVTGDHISNFDEDNIAHIWRKREDSDIYTSESNYIDLDGNVLLSSWY